MSKKFYTYAQFRLNVSHQCNVAAQQLQFGLLAGEYIKYYGNYRGTYSELTAEKMQYLERQSLSKAKTGTDAIQGVVSIHGSSETAANPQRPNSDEPHLFESHC